MVVSQRARSSWCKVPAKGSEHNFERVAFMGQVPVKVAGPVAVGDYILPFPGTAMVLGWRINPADMKIGDYAEIARCGLGGCRNDSRSELCQCRSGRGSPTI